MGGRMDEWTDGRTDRQTDNTKLFPNLGTLQPEQKDRQAAKKHCPGKEAQDMSVHRMRDSGTKAQLQQIPDVRGPQQPPHRIYFFSVCVYLHLPLTSLPGQRLLKKAPSESTLPVTSS